MVNQKGLSPILTILIVMIGLFIVGQIIYKFKLLQVKPNIIRQEDIVQNDQPRDLTCNKPLSFSLVHPNDATESAKRIYNDNPTCFYDLTSNNYSIFIAPAGKYNEWGAYGAIHTKKPYSVVIGSQPVNGEEIIGTSKESRVVLKGIQGYDFGITYNNQEATTKKQVSDILKTFKLTD